jgi:hypothetical protein
MKNTLIAVAVVAVIAVAGGAYYVLSNLDRLIADAIEYYGSDATGTSVVVSGVDVSLGEGKASIEGLSVANPEGFEFPYAFTLSSVTVDIDTGSIGGEPIRIELIDVRGPEVFFEVDADGRDNLRTIQGNLASTGDTSGPVGDQPSPVLSIDRIELSEGVLHARIAPVNESRDLSMPPVTMTDLEGQPAEIATQVASRLLDTARARVREEGVGRLRDRAREELNEEMDGLKDKAAEKLKDRLGI